MYYLFLLFTVLLYSPTNTQNQFCKSKGEKAEYTIEIPCNFKKLKKIGTNIDLKVGDESGTSIVTVVRNLAIGTPNNAIIEFDKVPISDLQEGLEANGLENVNILKKGLLLINNRKSFYQYYTSASNNIKLYHHNIMQFREGKLLNLTLTCDNSQKSLYMPIFFRIVNSLN